MLRKLFIFIIAIVLVFTAFALISGRTYLFKAVMYNFANIDDYEKFINHTVKSGIAKPWKVATNYNKTALPDSLAGLMEDLSSVGLLLIKNDIGMDIQIVLCRVHFPWPRALPAY